MSDQVFSLWSSRIKPKVLSPTAILRMQADALGKLTGGILQAEVQQHEPEGTDKIVLSFDLVAPALHDYRHTIMKIAHQKDLPYPAIVEADVFREGEYRLSSFSSKR